MATLAKAASPVAAQTDLTTFVCRNLINIDKIAATIKEASKVSRKVIKNAGSIEKY